MTPPGVTSTKIGCDELLLHTGPISQDMGTGHVGEEGNHPNPTRTCVVLAVDISTAGNVSKGPMFSSSTFAALWSLYPMGMMVVVLV